MSIRKGDIVVVICGDDRDRTGAAPTTGKVLRVLPKAGKIVVEGINRVYKHLKPSRKNPQGGRLSKEMPVNVSNVQLFCGTCRRGVRVGKRYTADGAKERFCKKCGGNLGGLSKARKPYAGR